MRAREPSRRSFALAGAAFGLFDVFSSEVLSAPQSEVLCQGDGNRVALLIGNQNDMGSMQGAE